MLLAVVALDAFKGANVLPGFAGHNQGESHYPAALFALARDQQFRPELQRVLGFVGFAHNSLLGLFLQHVPDWSAALC
jgi:hypothetical protein